MTTQPLDTSAILGTRCSATTDRLLAVLNAARVLLERREDQMVTSAE